ncbi:hypothetical protein VTO42DRAFT_3660 [Malbranchea cinnamomea]
MPPLTDFIVPHGKNAWQKHGQDQYALGNYAEALEAFNKAIRLGQGDYVGILDNRAATYSALGNLDSALNDGRRMIKVDKNDSRGYLRTAKILQLQKKYEDALRIYDYGLKVLDPSNEGCQKIRSLKSKLHTIIHGPNIRDPFTILPPEIIAEILRYLDLKDLLRAIRVSKLWQRLAVSFAKSWSHLDLSIATKRVTPTEIRAYLRRFHSILTHVTLANVKENSLPDVVTLLSRCPKLIFCEVTQISLDMRTTFVPFQSLAKLTSLVIQPELKMTLHQFLEVLRRCRHLEHVKVHLCSTRSETTPQLPALPNLRSLTVHSSLYRRSLHTLPIAFLSEDDLADKLPNVEDLCIFKEVDDSNMSYSFNVENLRHLRRYELHDIIFDTLPKWPKSLEHLALSRGSVFDAHVTEVSEHFEGMTNLKSVTLSNNSFITIEMVTALLTHSKDTLKSLDIQWTSIEFDELKDLMRAGLLENITHLNIAGICNVGDDATTVIIDTMPNLKILDLSSTQIGPLGLRTLVDTDKLRLEKLSVRNTSLQTSRDIIDYARSRGIQIPSLQTRNNESRGRTIRFADL